MMLSILAENASSVMGAGGLIGGGALATPILLKLWRDCQNTTESAKSSNRLLRRKLRRRGRLLVDRDREVTFTIEALERLGAVMGGTDEPASAQPTKTVKSLQELLKELEARSLRNAETKRSDPAELRKALESLVQTLIEKQEGASGHPPT